jgi:hypothetical protein
MRGQQQPQPTEPMQPTSRSSLGVLLQLRREGKLAAAGASAAGALSKSSLPFTPAFTSNRGSIGGGFQAADSRGSSGGGGRSLGGGQRFGLGPQGRPVLGQQQQLRPQLGAFMRR